MTLNSSLHKKLLLNLISFTDSISVLKKRLNVVAWDQPDELITLKFFHVRKAIELFLSNEINAIELENWANLIESREDIGFENEYVKEMIYRLANPVLEGEINESNCNNLLAGIRSANKDSRC